MIMKPCDICNKCNSYWAKEVIIHRNGKLEGSICHLTFKDNHLPQKTMEKIEKIEYLRKEYPELYQSKEFFEISKLIYTNKEKFLDRLRHIELLDVSKDCPHYTELLVAMLNE